MAQLMSWALLVAEVAQAEVKADVGPTHAIMVAEANLLVHTGSPPQPDGVKAKGPVA